MNCEWGLMMQVMRNKDDLLPNGCDAVIIASWSRFIELSNWRTWPDGNLPESALESLKSERRTTVSETLAGVRSRSATRGTRTREALPSRPLIAEGIYRHRQELSFIRWCREQTPIVLDISFTLPITFFGLSNDKKCPPGPPESHVAPQRTWALSNIGVYR